MTMSTPAKRPQTTSAARRKSRWSEEKRKYPLVQVRGGVILRLRPVRGIWHGEWVDAEAHRRSLSLETRSLTTALIVARERSLELANPQSEIRHPKSTGRSIASALASYYAWAEQRLRPKTLVCYRCHLNRFSAGLAVDRLDAITGAMIEEHKATFDGVTNATVDRHVAAISAFLEHCRRMGWIESNPCRGIRRESRANRNAPIYARREDIGKILEVDGPYRLAVALGFYAGLRLGEVQHLTWDDVQLAEGRIIIRAHPEAGWEPKSRERRMVPIAPELAAILDQVPAPNRTNLVWIGRARGFRPWLLDHNLPLIHFQDLRHSFGTYAAAAGVPARRIQEWMGHSSITTTERYMASVPDQGDDIAKLTLK